MTQTRIPALLKPIAAAFVRNGTPAFLVGGAVRDMLIGKPIHDYDLASAADPDTAAALLRPFGTVYEVGAKYGTVAVAVAANGRREVVEVTTFRTETYPDAASRRPEVSFTDRLADDLSRRDFTINAMALDLSSGMLVDLFNGAEDLTNRILRTPSDPAVAFDDDPLRIVRAARFVALGGFTMVPALVTAAIRLAGRLGMVARERITAEFEKVLTYPQATGAFIHACERLGITEEVFGPFTPVEDIWKVTLPALSNRLQVLTVLTFATNSEPGQLIDRLRMDRVTVREVGTRVTALEVMTDSPSVARLRTAYRQVGAEAFTDAAEIASAANPSMKAQLDVIVAEDLSGPLPVTGADLVAAGFSGRAVGDALRTIERAFCHNPHISATDCWQALNN